MRRVTYLYLAYPKSLTTTSETHCHFPFRSDVVQLSYGDKDGWRQWCWQMSKSSVGVHAFKYDLAWVFSSRFGPENVHGEEALQHLPPGVKGEIEWGGDWYSTKRKWQSHFWEEWWEKKRITRVMRTNGEKLLDASICVKNVHAYWQQQID